MTAAKAAHGLLKGINNQRQSLYQADNTACCQSTSADITAEAAPHSARAKLLNHLGCWEYHLIGTIESNTWQDTEPHKNGTCKQYGGYTITTDVTYTQQCWQYIYTNLRTLEPLKAVSDFTWEYLQAISYKFVNCSQTKTCKNSLGRRFLAFASQQDFCTGSSLWIWQNTMLLNNKSLAERHHKQYTHNTADKSYNCNLYHGWSLSTPLLCPHKHSRQGKDTACCYGLTGRTNGLNHIVLQNGITLQQDTNNSH